MTAIQAEKWALRRTTVARILAMDPVRRRREEAELAARLAHLPGFAAAGTVLLYASTFAEEIETAPMLRLALDLGKRLACPRVDWRSGRLRLHIVDDPVLDLKPGARGIPEPGPDLPEVGPSEVDWVLVPGLVFDDSAYRLGRGKGHYDRLLLSLRADAPRWAVALGPQWVDALPIEPHDQPLDGVVGVDKIVTRMRDRSRVPIESQVPDGTDGNDLGGVSGPDGPGHRPSRRPD